MASSDNNNNNNNTSVPVPGAEIDVTTNTKPSDTSTDDKKAKECTYDAGIPKLARQNSTHSSESDVQYRRPRHRVDPYIRPYSPSPNRRNRIIPYRRENTNLLDSSTHLLDKVDKHDGIAELPFPSRGAIYLTTYPFTDNDVKKWAWLFSLNVRETNLLESSQSRNKYDGDSDAEHIVFPTARRGRNRSPFFNAATVEIPSIYLSRALNKEVIPESAANITYFIVVQNRHQPSGSKLLVAESRKAAGIIMFYEALRGESIVFVGATVGLTKKRMPTNKFKKVESLEEAAQVKEEGFVGIVC